jgi:hypothetical protein
MLNENSAINQLVKVGHFHFYRTWDFYAEFSGGKTAKNGWIKQQKAEQMIICSAFC